jgi:TatA/E family protein of Tat protein translocase
MSEILVILVLALIFLGPKKLPEIASGIGKAIREVRKATADIRSEIELDDAIRKPLEELREATMLPPEELKRRDEEKKWRAEREQQELREQEEARLAAEREDASTAAAHAVGEPSPVPPQPDLTVQDRPRYIPPNHKPIGAAAVAARNADTTSELSLAELESVMPDPAASGSSPSSSFGTLLPVSDKTIAMPMPPPMEASPGTTVPALPAPKPATLPKPSARLTPPIGTLKPPAAGDTVVTAAPVAKSPVASDTVVTAAPVARPPTGSVPRLPTGRYGAAKTASKTGEIVTGTTTTKSTTKTTTKTTSPTGGTPLATPTVPPSGPAPLAASADKHSGRVTEAQSPAPSSPASTSPSGRTAPPPFTKKA